MAETFCNFAEAAGFRGDLSGFFLPYRLWLGSEVDVLQTYPWHEYYLGADVLT